MALLFNIRVTREEWHPLFYISRAASKKPIKSG